jgi:transcriptional regulator with XRE-family HTH domain
MEKHTGLLSQRLKRFRLNKKMSQLDLEVITGIAFGTISRIEHERINPTKETLFKIALALQLNQNETIELFELDKYKLIPEGQVKDEQYMS